MLRRDIRKFTLTYGGNSCECEAPASVRTVFPLACGESGLLTDEAVFSTVLNADSAAILSKYLYVRLFELKCSASVFINGVEAGRSEGVRPQISHSVKELIKEGENTLEVKFKKGADSALAGIFAPIKILRFENAAIDRVSVVQRRDGDEVNLGVRLELLGDPDSVRAVATLVSSAGRLYYGGIVNGKGNVCVKDPLYWWPRGMGVSNLYRLSVNLYGEGEIEDSVELCVGLRSAVAGEGASVLVNNLEIIPMGGVYYPESASLKGGEEKLSRLIEYAAMAGYNSILLPADAKRPPEKLYELCDIHGLLLIEELDNLDPDRLDCLQRVAHHPCLCAVDVIGEARDGIEKLSAICPDAALIGFDTRALYPSCPSLSTDNTINSRLDSSEKNIFSYEVESVSSPEQLRSMLWAASERYPYAMDMSDLTYVSGLAAAYRIERAVKSARLMKNRSERAIFDCLYDGNSIASRSAIDCDLRWKPLQYRTSRFFAPVALFAENRESTVTFSLSNQRPIDLIGTVEYRIADADNNTVLTGSEPFELPAFGSGELFSKDFSRIIEGHKRDYYLEYYFKEGVSRHSRGTLLFVPEKHFKFKKANIKVQLSGSDRRYTLIISADRFVKDLELSLPGVDGIFSENYIDITDSAPIRIMLNLTHSPDNAYRLDRLLKLRSVYDISN